MMRFALLPLLLLSAPAAAQYAPPAPAPTPLPAPAPAVWDPVGPYITAGQDEPGYRAWYAGASWRRDYVRNFHHYLTQNGVAGIVPTWQLLRTATSWRRCGSEPFEVPPVQQWPQIVRTLRYIHHFVVPAIGPVEPVSGYRNPHLNVCAGGAPESAHKSYSAIDLVPLTPTTREHMMRTLCAVHNQRGSEYGVGLGFYAFIRFHVDTTKFRRWGADESAPDCPPIIRPEDVASVALPPPQPEPLAPLPAPAPNASTLSATTGAAPSLQQQQAAQPKQQQ